MTDRYAVFGHPIQHSKSPRIHAAFAAQTEQDMRYEAIEAPLDGIVEALAVFWASGAVGANVTVPFKEDVYRLVSTAPNRLTARAQRAGAVNTLKREASTVLGDNTDGAGLVRDLVTNLGVNLAGARLLVLGAGGATRGVLGPLLEEKPAVLFVANRTASKARALAVLFSDAGNIRGGGFADIPGEPFDVVINATAASLAGELLPLPDDVFAPGALAYDLMYGRDTPFMCFARQHGARVVDGLGMLVEQAAEAFALWRGVRPHTEPVLAQLRTELHG